MAAFTTRLLVVGKILCGRLMTITQLATKAFITSVRKYELRRFRDETDQNMTSQS